jgi:CBS domain containing-hemolysin-like protein
VLGSVNFAEMLETVTGRKEQKIEDIPDTTVANWFMENLGRLPKSGETLEWHYLTARVARVIKHRVVDVNVTVNHDIMNKEKEED